MENNIVNAGCSFGITSTIETEMLNEISEIELLKTLTQAQDLPDQLPDKLSSRMISLTKEYPEIEYLLEKNGIGCISSGDIIAIKGKPKSGKTHALICIIAAILRGEYAGFKAKKENVIILYIDTEQNPLNSAILAKKVHSICGFPTDQDNQRFHVLNLRGDNPEIRCSLLRLAVKYFKPGLLVIDGVKDLIKGSNINDPEASSESIQLLMTLSKDYNLAIIASLHENKSLRDSNLRGHAGSELNNRSSEVWQVKKYEDSFDVFQTECRNEPAEGFSFMFNDEKLPVSTEQHVKKPAQDQTVKQFSAHLQACLPLGESLRYSDLRAQYIDLIDCSRCCR